MSKATLKNGEPLPKIGFGTFGSDHYSPAQMAQAERNCRLVKGQVFLWPGAESWKELWDE